LAGDAILKDLSAVVRAKLRREDVFARVGGEEFGILTPEVGIKGVRDVAEKVRLVVEQTTFRFEKHVMPTTISCGVSVWLKDEDSAEALYKRADGALYRAKQGGRNRIEQG
jgi:diguanylate cyclase (GGDEF)-like protein